LERAIYQQILPVPDARDGDVARHPAYVAALPQVSNDRIHCAALCCVSGTGQSGRYQELASFHREHGSWSVSVQSPRPRGRKNRIKPWSRHALQPPIGAMEIKDYHPRYARQSSFLLIFACVSLFFIFYPVVYRGFPSAQ
jgi:hypothetical protein